MRQGLGTALVASIGWLAPLGSSPRVAHLTGRIAPVASRLHIPSSADQLIVVSSPTDDPPGALATLRTYQRAGPGAPWRPVFGAWQAETGSGHLLAAARRREGDHATPIGVFGVGTTMYGTEPNPGGLRYRYHRLRCGDWWDEDRFSPDYNRFVHVPCTHTPSFSAWSEALWTEGNAYPYMAVIRFNMDPTVGGAGGRGSGIYRPPIPWSRSGGTVSSPGRSPDLR